jgi:hypothetical protein
MEIMMRTLKIEELELVAGAGIDAAPLKKGNNGLGNGDQTAPGGSGPNNGAENNAGGETNGSGKPVVPN